MSGQGEYCWPDGRRYEGEYKDGKMSGQGVFSWPDDQRYAGGWKNGKMSGSGLMWLPLPARPGKQIVFEGSFAEGCPVEGTAMEPGGALFRVAFTHRAPLSAKTLHAAKRTPAGRVTSGAPPAEAGGGPPPPWSTRVEDGVFRGLRPDGPATLVERGGAAYEAEYDGTRTIAEQPRPVRTQVRGRARPHDGPASSSALRAARRAPGARRSALAPPSPRAARGAARARGARTRR
jgi:hypothetical protein